MTLPRNTTRFGALHVAICVLSLATAVVHIYLGVITNVMVARPLPIGDRGVIGLAARAHTPDRMITEGGRLPATPRRTHGRFYNAL